MKSGRRCWQTPPAIQPMRWCGYWRHSASAWISCCKINNQLEKQRSLPVIRLARFFRLPADLPVALRSNIIHYYFDISWWGLYAGATAAFLTIYAARIGASAAQIGLLSALPAAISLALSLPF